MTSSVNTHTQPHINQATVGEDDILQSWERSLPPLWKDCTTATPRFIQPFYRQALTLFPVSRVSVAFFATTEMSWQNPFTIYLSAFTVFKAGCQGVTGCGDAFRRAASIHMATTALHFKGRFYKRSHVVICECIQIIHGKIWNNKWVSILGFIKR